jgi:hypothetical protein
MEDFARGRSGGWYWRQVLAAILINFVHELRFQWVTVGFAAFWTHVTVLIPTYLDHTGTGSFLGPFYGWAFGFDFPISVLIVMLVPFTVEVVTVWVGWDFT